jgi:four helix bundle protein
MPRSKYLGVMKVEDLIAYQKASELRRKVFKSTRLFPKTEQYSLTSQILRSSRSIAANISEGFGRFYQKDTLQFLNIARGSAFETKAHVETSIECDYLDQEKGRELLELNEEVIRILTGLIRSISRSDSKAKTTKK